MKTIPIQDSMDNIRLVLKEKQEQLKLRQYISAKYPDAEVCKLEDGSSAFISSKVPLAECTPHFLYEEARNRFLMRPFLMVARRGKKSIRVYSQHSYFLRRGPILDMLNEYVGGMALTDLPDSIQLVVGKIFESEADKTVDEVLAKADENYTESVT